MRAALLELEHSVNFFRDNALSWLDRRDRQKAERREHRAFSGELYKALGQLLDKQEESGFFDSIMLPLGEEKEFNPIPVKLFVIKGLYDHGNIRVWKSFRRNNEPEVLHGEGINTDGRETRNLYGQDVIINRTGNATIRRFIQLVNTAKELRDNQSQHS